MYQEQTQYILNHFAIDFRGKAPITELNGHSITMFMKPLYLGNSLDILHAYAHKYSS